MPKVEARRTPQAQWSFYPTRTVHQLPGFTPVAADPARLDKYGGLASQKTAATGFFYVRKAQDRWWLVDPEGCPFLHVAVVAVSPGKTRANRDALEQKFGTEEKWAQATTKMLRDHGFNGSGAWSDAELIRKSPTPLVYTLLWDFMSGYGQQRGGTYQKPGNTGYPNDTIFVFDPKFEAYCDERARELAKTKDDPYLLGHFSDNEMPFPSDALRKYLELNKDDPGCKAAREWLEKRKGLAAKTGEVNSKDCQEFLTYMAARYFDITSKAIKKYDPNHLFFGSRFHGRDLDDQNLFKGAGPYLDAVAVNYYNEWTPQPWRLKNWEKWSGKPVIITEWYVKGADAGLPNNSGAGWIVKTQQDRGLFYQNFALGLLQSKVCVGWHWFKYMDNDPSDMTTDPSNRDSNKGIVTIRYDEYKPLLDAMKELNEQAYALVDYFDKNPQR